MLNPYDPLQFKTNTEAAAKSGALGKQIRRKDAIKKPKRDFEKVMKSKEKKKTDDNLALKRKKQPGDKGGQHGRDPFKDLEETSTGALFGSLASKAGIGEESITERPEFLQEQPDIAAVNPNIELQGAQVTKTENVQRPDQVKQIEEIIDQIVNKVYILKQEGKTDTVMTLRYPPMFAGAQLRVTSYDTARGEFNLSFSQLSNEAKAVLDMQQARNDLQRHLEQRGYTAHIVVVTTEKDDPVIAAEESPYARGEEKEQQEKEENPREQKDDKEES